MPSSKFTDIDQYIASFPEEVRPILEDVRATLHSVLPDAKESISYNIPALSAEGRYVIYFAGFKHHIGLYPAPVNEAAFQKDFAPYKTGKGSVQFPLDQPMPHALIKKVAQFRLEQNRLKQAKKG